MNKIKLAIDLDNTIINYDDQFYKVARNKLRIQSNIKNKENNIRNRDNREINTNGTQHNNNNIKKLET